MLDHALPEIYTAGEIAAAAGVAEHEVRALVERGAVRSLATLVPGITGDARWAAYVPHHEAVRAVRALRSRTAGDLVDFPGGAFTGASSRADHFLEPIAERKRATTVPLMVSTSLHALAAAALMIITSLGLTTADEKTEPVEDPKPVRLVFLAQPGPGGGGGGGGLRMPKPAPKVERQGPRKISSPLPARRLPPPVQPPPPRPEPPPPPLEAKVLPPVQAPIAPIAADTRNREGELKETPPQTPPSQGPGVGGGAGSGQGTGIGEGSGSGVGPGEGGGMGGGPYRPGSGVEPPRLLREVRADYTEDARRAGIEGEVVMEIVVRRDGSVGDVRILRRLNAGLDQRAVQAVRQWRFSPARLKGAAVDVVVEVAVEFKLR